MANGEITRDEALKSEVAWKTYVSAHLERGQSERKALKAEIVEIKGRLSEIQTPGAAKWCLYQDGKIEALEHKIDTHRNALLTTALGALAAIGMWVFERVAK